MRSPAGFAVLLVACASLCRCSCGAEPIAAVTVKLRAAPASVDFGGVPVGASVRRTIAIANGGTGPYAPQQAPTVSGDGFVVATACALPILPGKFCNVDLAFSPASEGPKNGSYVVHVDDHGGDLLVVLTGIGDPAQIVVTPPSMDFGTVSVGTSASQSVHIENRGSADLAVPLALSGAGFFSGGAARQTVSVTAGQGVDVPVEFSPSQGGSFTGSAVVEVCGAGCGPSVVLTGIATAPRIDIEPRTVDFGDVAVGDHATADLVVSNTGAGNLVLTGADIAAPTGDVTVQGAGSFPITIAEGANTTITVAFSPTSPRGALSATLRVRCNDPISPSVIIPLDGRAPGPALEIVPSSILSFGVLDAGQERTADVVVRSIGTVPVDVTAITLTGSAFAFDAAPPAGTLAPDESILFTVRAHAGAGEAAAGGAQGTVVASATGLADLSLALTFLSGTAGCQPRALPANLSLGAVVVGQGSAGKLTVQNVGDGPCTLSASGPAPGLPFDLGFTFSAAAAATLPPGGTGTVDFAFQATDGGERSAFVDLSFNETPSPLLVSATARGVTGELVGEPPLIVMGPVVANCPVAGRAATFVNESGETVLVSAIVVDPPTAPFALQVPGLPANIGPGGAITVPVTAQNAAAGTFTATIRASSDVNEATVGLSLTVADPGATITETFKASDISQVDVLFVVDNSGSMADNQAILATNFDAFIQAAFAANNGVDFHLGVTTTGVIDGSGGPLVGPFLSRGTGGLADAFKAQALVGTNGSGIELGLEGMRLALDDDANTVNAGFQRTAAALSVIIVGDEDDNGGDPGVESFDPNAARAVDTYVEFLHGLKGGVLSNTPILVSTACTVQGGCARYGAVAQAFNGTVLDISDPTWGTQLAQVGAATFGLQRLFRLGTAPEPTTVTVTVDGVVQPAGSFTVTGDDVILGSDPPQNAQVVITYQPGCQ